MHGADRAPDAYMWRCVYQMGLRLPRSALALRMNSLQPAGAPPPHITRSCSGAAPRHEQKPPASWMT